MNREIQCLKITTSPRWNDIPIFLIALIIVLMPVLKIKDSIQILPC
ncbi:hypothetical protein [Candidatus Erwinia haradaeae]|nr:hypothetical protein [Candidatus Erwinia haradaeae]